MIDMRSSKPNSMTPWNCVICAIDPGKVSGVAIYRLSKLFDYGRTHEGAVEEWVGGAWDSAMCTSTPLIFVIERHNHHGKWNDAGLAGVSESVGVWKHYIQQLPVIKPRGWSPKILRVKVDEWRSGIFGHCRAPRTCFDKKTRKMTTDKRYWKQVACQRAGVTDHNEAEAILIGEYATKWWKVGTCTGVKPIGG
jgi:hypothetical protein